ncbi:MAG TPA: DUF2127 domain-containing protein [Burkholderiales bacterium]|nr:DUF2127 domain-containing protein [Burkholderiales bacterium]
MPKSDSSSAGLRAVALFEATKGTLVLMAGFGLFRLLHRDAEHAANLLSRRLHLNPAKEHTRIFVELLSNLSSTRLWLFASLAAIYSCVRFIEAYGLWQNRAWAKWFAALSGAIYVPFELYELYLGPTRLKLAALILNLAVVAYMAYSIRGEPPSGAPRP